jgi:hypothetical protein
MQTGLIQVTHGIVYLIINKVKENVWATRSHLIKKQALRAEACLSGAFTPELKSPCRNWGAAIKG